MITLRCTQKLLRRLDARPSADAPASDSRLGDWYANLLYLRGEQLILCVSERTLLPVLVTARDGARFPERLREGLAEVLSALGVSKTTIDEELAAMRDYRIAKTNNRRVLGTMNDFAWMLECGRGGSASLVQLSIELANTPCSPLKGFPDQVTVALFSGGSDPRLH